MPPFQAHKVGQYKISEQSLSGLTTLTIPIPAGFKHLRVEAFSAWAAGGTSDLVSLRLSTGGSVDSGANYDSQLTIGNPAGTLNTSNSAGVTSITVGRGGTSASIPLYLSTAHFDIFRPDLATYTNVRGYSVSPDTGILHTIRGLWKNTGVVDGINLVALVGNAWSSRSFVRVYGEK